jgi:uncharacterized protein with ACT and thioredoxin-like domain
MSAHAIFITAFDRPGMMSALTRVLADHDANITHIDIHPETQPGHLLRGDCRTIAHRVSTI